MTPEKFMYVPRQSRREANLSPNSPAVCRCSVMWGGAHSTTVKGMNVCLA